MHVIRKSRVFTLILGLGSSDGETGKQRPCRPSSFGSSGVDCDAYKQTVVAGVIQNCTCSLQTHEPVHALDAGKTRQHAPHPVKVHVITFARCDISAIWSTLVP